MILKYWSILFLFVSNILVAQNCSTKSYVKSFYFENNQSSKGELIIQDQEKNLVSLNTSINANGSINGIINKITSNGNILWSKQYSINGFDNVVFNYILPRSKGNYLVLGRAFNQDPFSKQDITSSLLLLSINKFGNILWSKTLDAFVPATKNVYYPGNMISTKDGKIVINITVENRGLISRLPTNSYIIKLNDKAEIIWEKQLTGDDYFAISYFEDNYFKPMIQLPDGNIVIGGLFVKYTPQFFTLNTVGYHFAKLNYITGEEIWSNSYLFKNGPGSNILHELKSISILPNSDLSFITHSYTPFLPLNIITSSNGELKEALSYRYSNDSTEIRVAASNNLDSYGNQILLINDNKLGINTLLATDQNGGIMWQKAYKSVIGQIEKITPSIIKDDLGFIFSSTSEDKKNQYLYKVDTSGSLNCLITTKPITKSSVLSMLESFNDNIHIRDVDLPKFINNEMNEFNLILKNQNECIKSCCTEFVDTSKIYLCEGSTFVLPDSSLINQSGLYYIQKKNGSNCDSIHFYKIDITKDPLNLKLPTDTCLNIGDTITLSATPGFKTYTWMGNIDTQFPYFKISKPGKYSVSVTNSCGNKTVSTYVFETCDFPVYMPNAFTPETGINNIYRYPSINKNKFISLKIFNRFGQLIFNSTDPLKGWNGKLNNEMQPIGCYVYLLDTKNHFGKVVSKKGFVMLLR